MEFTSEEACKKRPRTDAISTIVKNYVQKAKANPEFIEFAAKLCLGETPQCEKVALEEFFKAHFSQSELIQKHPQASHSQGLIATQLLSEELSLHSNQVNIKATTAAIQDYKKKYLETLASQFLRYQMDDYKKSKGSFDFCNKEAVENVFVSGLFTSDTIPRMQLYEYDITYFNKIDKIKICQDSIAQLKKSIEEKIKLATTTISQADSEWLWSACSDEKAENKSEAASISESCPKTVANAHTHFLENILKEHELNHVDVKDILISNSATLRKQSESYRQNALTILAQTQNEHENDFKSKLEYTLNEPKNLVTFLSNGSSNSCLPYLLLGAFPELSKSSINSDATNTFVKSSLIKKTCHQVLHQITDKLKKQNPKQDLTELTALAHQHCAYELIGQTWTKPKFEEDSKNPINACLKKVQFIQKLSSVFENDKDKEEAIKLITPKLYSLEWLKKEAEPTNTEALQLYNNWQSQQLHIYKELAKKAYLDVTAAPPSKGKLDDIKRWAKGKLATKPSAYQICGDKFVARLKEIMKDKYTIPESTAMTFQIQAQAYCRESLFTAK